MAPAEHDRLVAQERAAYRRGVVLGLTMAEVGILIIFVLLLLVGFKEWSTVVAKQAAKDQVSMPRDRATELSQAESQLTAVKTALNLSPASTPEEIRTLVRALVQTTDTTEGQTALRETREALAALQAIQADLERSGQPAELANKVKQQTLALANQEGQLKRYESQLQKAGLGKGERPCWVQPDGTIEFLYDVVLETDGIRLKEVSLPNRSEERAALPMPRVDPSELVSPGDFLTRTRPLYNSSLAKNCRFFVTVYDGTGPTEKERYKALLRTVEGHFYKRLTGDPVPF